ncbi:hypothetical protein M6B38_379165 [Iris pallida]|uniref:Uncharacterized protein n=1 Tax=Iris pallida TaxID=29817 RepID=A0AAX6G954_IRIPA|nr:hypothetical protein M6B38_379165 [Iris pallida]
MVRVQIVMSVSGAGKQGLLGLESAYVGRTHSLNVSLISIECSMEHLMVNY